MVDAQAEFASALTGLVGRQLQEVLYRSLRDPDDRESDVDPADSELSADPEVELRFDSGRVAFITWGQGRGWPGDCSLIVSTGTLGKPPDVYREADASTVPLWQPHIGQPLAEVQVYGRDGTPYLVRLTFPSGAVLVGTGSSELNSYGDGLDVLVRPSEPRYLAATNALWGEGTQPDWDRTRDWLIQRSRHYDLATVVVFATAQPSMDELRRARKLRLEFSNESPATFRRRIDNGRLDLGVAPREEGRALVTLAASLGLVVEHKATARTVYLFKTQSGPPGYLVVEDDADAERLATAMIAAGVPVVDVEVD
jgi:hypothetical protein